MLSRVNHMAHMQTPTKMQPCELLCANVIPTAWPMSLVSSSVLCLPRSLNGSEPRRHAST